MKISETLYIPFQMVHFFTCWKHTSLDKWDAGGEGQWFEDRLRFFNAGMIYFTYLTDFCYFPLKIVFRKLLAHEG
jgi:hypothetical protein